MKKILLSIGVVLTSISLNAQVDTLTEFFTGAPTIYSAATADGGGYVAGNNGYGDLAKMQLFDATHGVTSGGSITNLLLWAPIKDGTTGTFRAVIWANNAGAPGAELGSVTITLSTVDTVAANTMIAEMAVGYNISANFATAVAVPANGSFWAGIVLPTVAGDTIALVTNTDGDFPDAATHTGEFQSGGTFFSFNDGTNATWGLDIAMAIFPVVNFVAGVDENSMSASVYPNPAADVLNIKLTENATSVSILGMDGKVISTESVNSNLVAVNVSNLVSGVYFYEVVAENGTVIRNTFVKK